jgi:hypothetical protein
MVHINGCQRNNCTTYRQQAHYDRQIDPLSVEKFSHDLSGNDYRGDGNHNSVATWAVLSEFSRSDHSELDFTLEKTKLWGTCVFR